MTTPRHFKGTNNEKIWHAMRILKKFTVRDLEVLSGAKHYQVRLYLSYLNRTGYLMRFPKIKNISRFFLIKNTGPLSPILRQKHKMVYDQNTEENINVK